MACEGGHRGSGLTFPRHMQDCFRKYPEVYGSELTDDDDEAAPAPEDAEAVAKTEEAKAQPAQKEEAASPKKAAVATEAAKSESK